MTSQCHMEMRRRHRSLPTRRDQWERGAGAGLNPAVPKQTTARGGGRPRPGGPGPVDPAQLTRPGPVRRCQTKAPVEPDPEPRHTAAPGHPEAPGPRNAYSPCRYRHRSLCRRAPGWAVARRGTARDGTAPAGAEVAAGAGAAGGPSPIALRGSAPRPPLPRTNRDLPTAERDVTKRPARPRPSANGRRRRGGRGGARRRGPGPRDPRVPPSRLRGRAGPRRGWAPSARSAPGR